MTTRSAFRAVALAAAVLSIAAVAPERKSKAAPPAPASDAVDRNLLRGLEWRNIGPHRGGRVVAGAGGPRPPHGYYFGGPGGGAWETTPRGLPPAHVSHGPPAARPRGGGG